MSTAKAMLLILLVGLWGDTASASIITFPSPQVAAPDAAPVISHLYLRDFSREGKESASEEPAMDLLSMTPEDQLETDIHLDASGLLKDQSPTVFDDQGDDEEGHHGDGGMQEPPSGDDDLNGDVPEPGTASLLLLAGSWLLARRPAKVRRG